jgi:hypothetical protein
MSNIKNIMQISDEPYKSTARQSDQIDLYIMCEGFKYTLREWRRWTHDLLEIDEDSFVTRGEYSMMFANEINGILNNNGYVLLYRIDSIARRFMHYWLQLYNSNGFCAKLPLPHHNGNNLEYEDWNRLFTPEFWERIGEEYVVYNAFDNTRIGKELLINIGDFFWNYIDVNRSSAIIEKREEERRIEEEMMRWGDEPVEQNKVAIPSKDKTQEVIDRND